MKQIFYTGRHRQRTVRIRRVDQLGEQPTAVNDFAMLEQLLSYPETARGRATVPTS